jgi:hypothetical protein
MYNFAITWYITTTQLKKKYYFHNRLTNALVYYGLMLTSTQLAGDRYLNFFINVGVELPAVISFVFLVKRYIHNTISFKICSEPKWSVIMSSDLDATVYQRCRFQFR